VHAYPARGTHATYPDICTGATIVCGQNRSDAPERQHGGERRWSNNDSTAALLKMPTVGAAGAPWANTAKAWTDWPGRWGSNGSPQSPGNQSTFKQPWDAFCADDNENAACVARRSVNATRAAAHTSATDCQSWFGTTVQAVVCSPSQLRTALEQRRLGKRGSITLKRSSGTHRGTAASAPGLAQLKGRPLRPNQQLVIDGALPSDARLYVRATDGTFQEDTEFRTGRTASRLRVKILRRNRAGARASRTEPTVEVVARGERSLRPTATRSQRLRR